MSTNDPDLEEEVSPYSPPRKNNMHPHVEEFLRQARIDSVKFEKMKALLWNILTLLDYFPDRDRSRIEHEARMIIDDDYPRYYMAKLNLDATIEKQKELMLEGFPESVAFQKAWQFIQEPIDINELWESNETESLQLLGIPTELVLAIKEKTS